MKFLTLLLCLLCVPGPLTVAQSGDNSIDILRVKDQAGRECWVNELVEVRLALKLPPRNVVQNCQDRYHQMVKMRRQAIKHNPHLDASKVKIPFVVDDPTWFHILAWSWMNRRQLGNLDIGHAWLWINAGGCQNQWEFSPYRDAFGTDINNDNHLGIVRWSRHLKPTHTLPMLLGPESMEKLYAGFSADIDGRLVFNAFGSGAGQNCLRWAVDSLLNAGARLPKNFGKLHELSLAVAVEGEGLKWIDHSTAGKVPKP